MGRSRMFGDDDPVEAPNASPRTTIVGGRPPEAKADLPPVPTGIQKLLRLASVDETFRKELVERRAGIAAAAGVELSASEGAILGAIPAEQLLRMVEFLPEPPASRRTFLRQTASTAVMLLGGAVLAECTGCGSSRKTPDSQPEAGVPPPEVPDAAGASIGEPPVPPAGWDAGPPRPYEPAPPTAGVRPQLGSPPQPPIDLEADAGGDVADAAPRPEEPRPTRGIQPDLPPERPPTRPMDTEGGAAPSLPPVRPDRNINAPGGARPDMPPPPSLLEKR